MISSGVGSPIPLIDAHIFQGSTPEGQLRFPVAVERAMMGDQVQKPVPYTPINPTPEIPAFETLQDQLRFPEEVERGMTIDAMEDNVIR